MSDTLEALSPLAAELRAELLRIARAPLALTLDEPEHYPEDDYAPELIAQAQEALDTYHPDSCFWGTRRAAEREDVIEALGLKATVIPCLHDWAAGTDWYGDSNVYRGTCSFTVYRCLTCGDEAEDVPEDFDADEQQRRRDDAMADAHEGYCSRYGRDP